MCLSIHEPPAKMKYTVGVMDGELNANYTCDIFEAFMTPAKWKDYDYEMSEGGVLEDEDYKAFKEQYLKSEQQ